MFKFILKQQNYKNSEYTDLTKYDNNNVHQNSITNIAQNFLLKLCNEIKLPENYKENIIKSLNNKINEEINLEIKDDNEDKNEIEYINIIDNKFNEFLSNSSKLLMNIIFQMDLKYDPLDMSESEILLYIIHHINNLNNDKDISIKKLNNCLENCFESYDETNSISCLEGRIIKLLECLNITYIPLWVYKERIVSTILYYHNKLLEYNNLYKHLYYLDNDKLSQKEKSILMLINYRLISHLNKKLTDIYVKTNIIDSKILANIILNVYKELFFNNYI